MNRDSECECEKCEEPMGRSSSTLCLGCLRRVCEDCTSSNVGECVDCAEEEDDQ